MYRLLRQKCCDVVTDFQMLNLKEKLKMQIQSFQRSEDGSLYVLDTDGVLWFGQHFASCGPEAFMRKIEFQVASPTLHTTHERTYEDIPF